MTRVKADLLLLLVAVIWGLGFVFQKTAMDAIGPMTFIAARSLVGALALVPFALRESRAHAKPITPEFWRITALASLALFVAEAMQQFGLVTATVTNAGFLTALYVVCVPFITWIATRQAPIAIVWPAAALSFAGTWLLGGGDMAALSAGDRLLAVSAIVWALHVVVTGSAANYDRPVLFICLQFWIVTVVSVVWAGVTEPITIAALQSAWLEIAFVGLFSSALMFTLMVIAMRRAPPAEAAIILSTENLFAALGGAVFLGERLNIINWIGAALIVVATLAVQLAPHWRRRQPS
jgi:drug/metabolite transporter (DMT)-like permease